MAGYNIYGIGGALLDIEVNVSETFLSQSKIRKGSMTLVDQGMQTKLMNQLNLSKRNIKKSCGGSVCNSVVAASHLGSNVYFSGKVATGLDGDFFYEELKKCGISFDKAGQETGITGTCLVMITEDAERTLVTCLGSSEKFTSCDIDLLELANSEWLLAESYLVSSSLNLLALQHAFEKARQKNVKIALSLSDYFLVLNFLELIQKLIGDGIDLIFCNKQEAHF